MNGKMTPEEAMALADSYFTNSYNCAQSVLQAVQAYYGVEDEGLWKLATGLGAGISRQGFACGALTGGALACGLAVAHEHGSTRDTRWALRDETYTRVQELTRSFEARFGTVNCWEMTKCDFRTPEGQARFKSEGLMDNVCRPAVQLMVERIIGSQA